MSLQMTFIDMNNSNLHAVAGGITGTLALTAIHQTLKQFVPYAPKVDRLGMQAIAKGLHQAGQQAPSEQTLFGLSLAGDLISNSTYYTMVGKGKPEHVWYRGIVLGAAAGLGSIFLPGPMGLNESYTKRTLKTELLTFGIYLAGGLIAAATVNYLHRREKDKHQLH